MAGGEQPTGDWWQGRQKGAKDGAVSGPASDWFGLLSHHPLAISANWFPD